MTTPTPAEVADELNRLLLDLDDMEQTTPEYADQQHALINYLDLHMGTVLVALRALGEPSAFVATTRNFQLPAPKLNIGGQPCGECHIQPGETCDICGACIPPVALGEPDEAAVERAGRAAYEKFHRPYEWQHASSNSRAFWRDIARAALRSRAADES